VSAQKQPEAPDALLFITPGCPHCQVVLDGLAALVKEGTVGRLEVVNAAARPQLTAEQGVRSAPWTRIGDFEFEGQLSPAELREWATHAGARDGFTRYVREKLGEGRLDRVEALMRARPDMLDAVLPLIEDPELPMQIRVGVGAVLESLEGDPALGALVPELGRLSTHADHRVRADACHYLGLATTDEALEYLRARLEDENAEVREIAEEALKKVYDHK
jgi:HEAT repeat protein